MTFALLVVVIALGWAAATGSFDFATLLFGAAIGAGALFLVRDRIAGPAALRRTRAILSLTWLFLVELMKSAWNVAVLVMRPDMHAHLKPGIVAVPLRLTGDAQIVLLANLITLTPGTLTVDVSEDRKLLYVHGVSVPDRDALLRDIADGFEQKIMEAFP